MKALDYYRLVNVERRKWAASVKHVCMYCLSRHGWLGLQTHEICRRSTAPNRWGHPCNYLLLCQDCHDKHFSTMPYARQLAVKKLRDHAHYDLVAWMKILDPLGRTPNRVTPQEVYDEEVELTWLRCP